MKKANKKIIKKIIDAIILFEKIDEDDFIDAVNELPYELYRYWIWLAMIIKDKKQHEEMGKDTDNNMDEIEKEECSKCKNKTCEKNKKNNTMLRNLYNDLKTGDHNE